MDITAPIAFRPRHVGWLVAALILHALGSAALQFSGEYVSLFEAPRDWALRVFTLCWLAFSLIQLSALILRRLAGSEVAAIMRLRMIAATLIVGLLGITSLADDLPRAVVFGLVVGLAWRKWTSSPLLWLLAAAAAGLVAHWVDGSSRGLINSLSQTVGFPGNRVIYASYLGLIWSLLAGVAFGLLVTFAPPESWEIWQETIRGRLGRLPLPQMLSGLLVALLLAGSLWFVYARGMQNCGWLDRLLGRSGCVDRLDTGWNYHDSLDFSQDGATLLIGGSEDVVLYDFASRRAIQALKTPGGRVAEGAAISADGSQFAMYLNSQFTDQLKIYRRGQTEPFQSIAVGEAAMPDLGFSLDGRSLRFQNASFDIATGAPLGRITSDTSADYRIISQEFSADGSLRIQSNGAEVGLYRSRFDGSIGTLIKILPEPPSLSAPVTAFTDDNRLVATSIHNDDTLIKIWRTSNGSLLTTIALTREENAAVSALAFTPDNRLLLVSRYFQDAIEIYQVPPEANP